MPAESMDMDQMQRAIVALQAEVATLTATSGAAGLVAVLSALASTPSYANDTAAGAAGVTVGGITGIYRNGNIVQIRVT